MTDYKGFRIEKLHAIVGIDEDDAEAVPAVMIGLVWTPLIASDRVRLAQMKEMAQQIANETGKNFKIVRFSVREEVGEIKSKKVN